MRSPRSPGRCRVARGMPASSRRELRCGCPSGAPARSRWRCATRTGSSRACTTTSALAAGRQRLGASAPPLQGPRHRRPVAPRGTGPRAPARSAAGDAGDAVHTPEAVALPLPAHTRRRELRGDRRRALDSRRSLSGPPDQPAVPRRRPARRGAWTRRRRPSGSGPRRSSVPSRRRRRTPSRPVRWPWRPCRRRRPRRRIRRSCRIRIRGPLRRRLRLRRRRIRGRPCRTGSCRRSRRWERCRPGTPVRCRQRR